MKAIVVTDQAAGTAGMKLVERPEPQGAALASLSGANYGDVIVQVHASGFTGDELAWPSTWIDRLGRDRTPSAVRRRSTSARRSLWTSKTTLWKMSAESIWCSMSSAATSRSGPRA